MFVDFTFAYIRQEHISTRALAHIHVGDVTTEDEPDDDKVMQPVTRYRQLGILEEVFLNFPEGATMAELEAAMQERLGRLLLPPYVREQNDG
jgi:hypothetical protein